MNRNLLLSFLLAASTAGGAFYTFPKAETPGEEPKLIPSSKSSDTNHIFSVANNPKKLEDLLKEYLKTITGAKSLSNFIAASLAVDFIDTRSSETSSLGDRLRAELSSLRNSKPLETMGEEQRKKTLFDFGDDQDLHRDHHILTSILRKFPEVLSDYLKDSIGDNNLKNTNGSDPILKEMGEFLDHVLDDYLEIERPLFVRMFTWRYGGNQSSIKALFDENALPEGITLPNSGSYFFPLFSQSTETKFSKFIGELNKSSSDFSNVSDESKSLHLLPLSSTSTSQQTIALLELLGHAMGYKQWKDSNKGTNGDNLSTNYTGTSKTICDSSNDSQKIPTISISDLSSDENAKSLSKVFCVDKDHNPYKTEKLFTDIFYLKKKNGSQDKPEGWVVFKDIHGVHAMSLDLDLTTDDLKEATKKKLLAAAKESGASGHRWNINSELGSHLRKHFVRLFLEKYEFIAGKISTGGNSTFQELSKKLAELLQSDLRTDSLRSLRSKILGDYANTASSQKPLEVNATFKSINPTHGWAGKLPHKPGAKFLNETTETKFKGYGYVFDYYERLILAEFKKLDSDILPISSKFSKTADPSSFKDLIDPLFTSSVTSRKSEKNNFFSIVKLNPPISTTFKTLNINSLLNLVWVSGLLENTIIDHMIQTRIKESQKLAFYDWSDSSKKFKESGTIDNETSKDLFDSDSQEETLFNSIVKNFLLSKYLGKFIDSPEIHVNAPDGTINLSELTDPQKLLEFLKNVDGHQKKVFSSTFSDLLSREAKEMFTELLTLKYLVSDKMNHFRRHLRKKMSRTDLSGFIFSRKFVSDDHCRPKTTKPTSDDPVNLKVELGSSRDLNSKYLGYTQNNLTSVNCIPRSDLFRFSRAKLPKEDGTKSEQFTNLSGHRGLYSSDMKDILPQEMVDLISGNAMVWRSQESLKNHILSLKSEAELNALIGRLKSRFPDYDWSLVEGDRMIEPAPANYNWRSPFANRMEDIGEKISFGKRRRILLNFLNQSDWDVFNPNHSLQTLRERQLKLLEEPNGSQSMSLLSPDLFKRHYGWIKDKGGEYLIEDSSKNKHSIFFIQLKYDDLENQDSWTSFLKEMPQDLVVKELIKASKDKDAQRQALTHHLMESKDPMDIFEVNEERIREKMEFGWIK